MEQHEKIYRSLCYVLSERAGQVAWDEFTPTDWDLFSEMAKKEGVAPLMYWKLKDSPSEVPFSTFNLLRLTYYQTLAQNALMYQELERILKALDEVGIPVIVLKGAALAAMLYEDIGLRPMGDLDLLVRREQLDQALSVFQNLSYRKKIRDPRLASWIERIAGYDIQFISDEPEPVIVELHWNLIAGDADWRSPSVEWFWGHLERIHAPLNQDWGEKFLGLSPSAQLLYLAAHLMMKHDGVDTRLVWLFDIYLLQSRFSETINWAEVPRIANQFRWSDALRHLLCGLQAHFAVSIPGNLMESLSEDSDQQSDAIIRRKKSGIRTRSLRDWNRLASLNWSARLLLLIAILLPNRKFMIWRYHPRPAWLWPLYYPYRWIEIFVDSVSTFTTWFQHRLVKRFLP